jgi:hypothetical protein
LKIKIIDKKMYPPPPLVEEGVRGRRPPLPSPLLQQKTLEERELTWLLLKLNENS